MSDFESVIRKLPKAQRRALDNLCCGLPTKVSRQVWSELSRLGLIVGVNSIEYSVPIAVHIAWCAVCSEEWAAMSPEERATAETPE